MNADETKVDTHELARPPIPAESWTRTSWRVHRPLTDDSGQVMTMTKVDTHELARPPIPDGR